MTDDYSPQRMFRLLDVISLGVAGIETRLDVTSG
jgi:hypothetical protein